MKENIIIKELERNGRLVELERKAFGIILTKGINELLNEVRTNYGCQ